jgi:hypothetical protein
MSNMPVKMVRMGDWYRMKNAIKHLVDSADDGGCTPDLAVVSNSGIEHVRAARELIEASPDAEVEDGLFDHFGPLEAEYNKKAEQGFMSEEELKMLE